MPLFERSSSPLSSRVAWISAILLLLAAGRVHAEDDAKAHYQKATAHFAVGEYHDAAIEYEEAFKLKQDPAILFNAAQSFRLAGDNQKALLLYNNIIKLYPGTKYAKDSKERIEKLAQGTPAPAPTAPAPTAPPPAPVAAPAAPAPAPVTPITPPPSAAPPLAPETSAPPSAAATVVSTPAPPSEGAPVYTKWWFWTAIGVVAVGAIVAGVALSSGGSTTPWNNTETIMAGVVRR
jgi:tetratricopeptide (TPR) repeat protein